MSNPIGNPPNSLAGASVAGVGPQPIGYNMLQAGGAQISATQAALSNLISGLARERQIFGANIGQQFNFGTPGTNIVQNSRLLYTADDDITNLSVVFDSMASVDVTYGCALEFPLDTADGAIPFTVNGASTWTVIAAKQSVETAQIACAIPAGSTFAIRTYAKLVDTAQSLRGLNRVLQAGESTTALTNDTNQSNAVGALAGGSTGPSPTRAVGPAALITNRRKIPTIVGFGDSIQAGVGIPDNIPTPGYTVMFDNWFVGGLRRIGYPNYLNYSIGNEKISTLYDGLAGGVSTWQGRLAKLRYADVVFSDLAYNDFAAKTWQEIAQYHMKLAQQLAVVGVELIIVTAVPATGVTGNLWRADTQIPVYVEKRNSWNTWVRNGRQVDASGNPVLGGGTPFPYIRRYFDLAEALEVNSQNVKDRGGNRWICPVAPLFQNLQITGVSGTIAGGTPVLTVNTTSLPVYGGGNPGLNGMVAVIQTGVAAGQSAICQTANANNTIRLYGTSTGSPTGVNVPSLTNLPANGDLVSIWQSASNDGVHPTAWGYNLGMDAFAAWLINNGFQV